MLLIINDLGCVREGKNLNGMEVWVLYISQ